MPSDLTRMAFSTVSGELQYEITAQLLLHCQVGRTDWGEREEVGGGGAFPIVSFHH